MKVIRFLLLAFSFGLLHSELAWESLYQERKIGTDETRVVFTYKFKNIGKNDVTITQIKPDCSCATTKLKKTTYKPGESGEIPVNFDVGTRLGIQQKEIRVETNDTKTPITVLTFRAEIPQSIKVDPSVVYWMVGEKNTPKKALLTLDKSYKIRLQGVESTMPQFFPKLKEIKKGEIYEVEVKVDDTSRSLSGSIRISVLANEKACKPIFVHTLVKDPNASSIQSPAITPR